MVIFQISLFFQFKKKGGGWVYRRGNSSDPKDNKMTFYWKGPSELSNKSPPPFIPSSSKQLSHRATHYQGKFQHIPQSILLFPQLTIQLSFSSPRIAPWHFKIPLTGNKLPYSCLHSHILYLPFDHQIMQPPTHSVSPCSLPYPTSVLTMSSLNLPFDKPIMIECQSACFAPTHSLQKPYRENLKTR